MVTLVAVGTLFIAAGPALAIWLGFLHHRAHLLVITIFAAFTWCLATMAASIIWLAIPPLKSVYPWILFVVVTIQEAFRFLLFLSFRLINRSSSGIRVFIRPGCKNQVLTGLAVGVGFALMSSLMHFYPVLVDSFADDTAIYVSNCPINFFVAAAAFSMAFSLLHIFLGLLTWPAYSDPDGVPQVVISYAIHLALSEATLANRRRDGCVWGLGLVWGMVSVVFLLTVFLTRKRVIAAESE